MFQIGDRYHMVYLYRPPGGTDPREHEIYMAESADGMAWSQHVDNVHIGSGSVPGAAYFNGAIYVFNCGPPSLAPAPRVGDMNVAISRDEGTTFEFSHVTVEGRSLSGMVDPAAVVMSASSP